MTRIPVITGFGGYNAAGRSSFHHGYKRTIFQSLPEIEQRKNCLATAVLMGLLIWKNNDYHWSEGGQYDPVHDFPRLRLIVEQATLVRRIETGLFDVDRVPVGRKISLGAEGSTSIVTMASRDVPDPLPAGWTLVAKEGRVATLEVTGDVQAFASDVAPLPVQAAGQLPSGFNPGAHYRSLHHPRGLQLAVLGASDALNSLGISWQTVVSRVRPDEIGVYSASVMSQLDATGLGGMMQARGQGARVTSKQLALGLNSMPADFVNAYVLGSIGATAGIAGACATFLYNLNAAVDDIKSGRRRVVMVGSAEAPIIPEVIEGYSAMSALATDAEIARLPGGTLDDGSVNYRSASRPFGENCGFTIAESGQYVLLMDDALAMELGADIYGAVPGVFVHADGFKKSISAPGPGNYMTMARAVGLATALVGEHAVRNSSFVQAHGSSTPQNRVTESQIFDRIASEFGIKAWPVAAVKAYLGHSLGPASGDQMANTLGVFAHGILPGIKTVDSFADDIHRSRLSLSNNDQELGIENSKVAFLNSKGFGGNNATATVVAPSVTERWMQKRYGDSEWHSYLDRREATRIAASEYDSAALRGDLKAAYHFGEALLTDDDLQWTEGKLGVKGFGQPVDLVNDGGFSDLLGD